MKSINESILFSFKNAFLLEDYKSAKTKLVEMGASEQEADSLIKRHRELKKLNRLDKSLIDIDRAVKDFSPSELKQKLFGISTQTKTEIKNRVEGKIVAENDEYWVYKIDTPEEAYRFHGLTEWCICSGDKERAREHFENYSNDYKNVFYFFVRKQITNPDDIWNYIALQRGVDKDDVYWDMKDKDHKLSDIPVKLPEFDKPPLEKLSLGEKLEKAGFKKNSNGEYDVDGDVYLSRFPELITDGKLNIKFGKVRNFDCSYIKTLTSLEGCPREIDECFCCNGCSNLTSLQGAPEKVGEDFYCAFCDNLTNLEGAPEKVGGMFECGYCKNLTSLKGAPKEVGGRFDCYECKNLKYLKGVPEKVGGDFDCSYCYKLKGFDGSPIEVGGDFVCVWCSEITRLDGVPEKVRGDFICRDCWVKFTEDDVKEHCEVSGSIKV